VGVGKEDPSPGATVPPGPAAGRPRPRPPDPPEAGRFRPRHAANDLVQLAGRRPREQLGNRQPALPHPVIGPNEAGGLVGGAPPVDAGGSPCKPDRQVSRAGEQAPAVGCPVAPDGAPSGGWSRPGAAVPGTLGERQRCLTADMGVQPPAPRRRSGPAVLRTPPVVGKRTRPGPVHGLGYPACDPQLPYQRPPEPPAAPDAVVWDASIGLAMRTRTLSDRPRDRHGRGAHPLEEGRGPTFG
jgi:hypothetical protein